MRLEESKFRLEQVVDWPFGDLFAREDYGWVFNKGKDGQALEMVFGRCNSSVPQDFEDGELKTNKCITNVQKQFGPDIRAVSLS